MREPTKPSKSPLAKGAKRAPALRVRKSKKAPRERLALPPEAQLVDANETRSEVLEFASAIDAYKRSERKPFPTWGEVLEVLKRLGYRRSA
ncbi:MAG: hypothetical protein FJ294_14140 [Planctomycetes bacterium]|nr:hypothetical protein [Planctomycetota bacterium]